MGGVVSKFCSSNSKNYFSYFGYFGYFDYFGEHYISEWGSISTIYRFLELWPMVDVICPTVCCVVLVFFKCLINLTSFLFKSKFISFSNHDSSHPLSHYYCCDNYHFYYYLLLIYIYIYIYILYIYIYIYYIHIYINIFFILSNISFVLHNLWQCLWIKHFRKSLHTQQKLKTN